MSERIWIIIAVIGCLGVLYNILINKNEKESVRKKDRKEREAINRIEQEIEEVRNSRDNDEELTGIVQQLIEATESGKIKWRDYGSTDGTGYSAAYKGTNLKTTDSGLYVDDLIISNSETGKLVSQLVRRIYEYLERQEEIKNRKSLDKVKGKLKK